MSWPEVLHERGVRTEAEFFAAYLEHYREACIEAVLSLSPEQQTTSTVLSGWTPASLLSHLAGMERRWFVWGFLGEHLDEPWPDSDPDSDGWLAPAGLDLEAVTADLRGTGTRTRQVLATHDLDEVAPAGPRFDPGPPASLRWICFHVLEEYARHAGHLDIAVELLSGAETTRSPA